jgi:hypothetical protein
MHWLIFWPSTVRSASYGSYQRLAYSPTAQNVDNFDQAKKLEIFIRHSRKSEMVKTIFVLVPQLHLHQKVIFYSLSQLFDALLSLFQSYNFNSSVVACRGQYIVLFPQPEI